MASYNEDSRQDYWESVTSIAGEANSLPEDERDDFVWQSVDGSYWVIYTHAAIKVYQYSDNDSLLFDELGTQEVDYFSSLVCRMAFYAMRADVHEALLGMDDE